MKFWILTTHLYALFVIIGHDSDALMSDTDVSSNAMFYHTIISLNDLEEKLDSIIRLKVINP